MFPILFKLGPLTFHTYGLFIALAVIAGTQMAIYWAVRNGMAKPKAEEAIYSLAFASLIGAILGARLFYVVTEWQQFRSSPVDILKIWEGGLVYYGGLTGGLIGSWAWLRKHPEFSWRKLADWVSPTLAVGHAIGRLGCFSAGCCYGRETSGPCAVIFTHPDSLAPIGIPLHPSQIYESLFLFSLGAVLWYQNAKKLEDKNRADGEIFGNYLIVYSIGRFALEFLRGDHSASQILGPAQIVSLVLLTGALAFRFSLRKV